MPNMKPGYLLELTTWENDGDNYKTERLYGLTKDEVKFYVHIANQFKSGNQVSGSLGNMPVWSDFNTDRRAINHNELFDRVIAEWVKAGNYAPEEWVRVVDDMAPETDDVDDYDYFYEDLLHKIVGQTDYGHWRVFEDFKVYYLPEAIYDISKQFK